MKKWNLISCPVPKHTHRGPWGHSRKEVCDPEATNGMRATMILKFSLKHKSDFTPLMVAFYSFLLTGRPPYVSYLPFKTLMHVKAFVIISISLIPAYLLLFVLPTFNVSNFVIKMEKGNKQKKNGKIKTLSPTFRWSGQRVLLFLISTFFPDNSSLNFIKV